MIWKILLLNVLLIFGFNWATAQNESVSTTVKNGVYGELLGEGLVLSVNYERYFYLNPNTFVSGRLGMGWIVLGYSVPHGVTINYGTKNRLEVGVGGVYVNGEFFSKFDGYLPMGIIGYRYQKPEGGFLFRASITPLFNITEKYDPDTQQYYNKTQGAFFGGVSFGTSF